MPLAAQPADASARVADEDARHRRVAAAQGHAAHVGEEVLRGVGVEVGVRQRLLGEELATSSRPPWAMRIAPAVNAELPPDHARVGLLEHEHARPRSRAACAAHRPALPAPATMTSGSVTARSPTCDPARVSAASLGHDGGRSRGVVARSSRPDASSTTSYRRTLPTHDHADRRRSGDHQAGSRNLPEDAPPFPPRTPRADPRRRRLRLPRAPRRDDRDAACCHGAAPCRGGATRRRDAGRSDAGAGAATRATAAGGRWPSAGSARPTRPWPRSSARRRTGPPSPDTSRLRRTTSAPRRSQVRLRLRRGHRLGADLDDHARCAIGTDDARRITAGTAVGRLRHDAGRDHLRRRRRGHDDAAEIGVSRSDPGHPVRDVATLPHPLRYAAVASIGGHVLVAGGTDGVHGRSEVLSIDPGTHRVRVIAHLPAPLSHAAGAVLGDRFLVVGGRGDAPDAQRTSIWAIDPAHPRPVVAGRLPTALSDVGTATLHGSVLVVGGRDRRGRVHAGILRLQVAHDVYAADRPSTLSPVVARDPRRVYVPNSESDSVDVVDQRTRPGRRALRRRAQPQHVTPSWDLRTLWVTNDLGNSLTPIDPRTGRAGQPVPVTDPYNLYFTTDGRGRSSSRRRSGELDFRDAAHDGAAARARGCRNAPASTTWTTPPTAATRSCPASSAAG